MEQWKDIKDYEGYYQASTLGNIRSVKSKPRLLIPYQSNGTGHYRIQLNRGVNDKKHFRVCELIINTFVPNQKQYNTFYIIDGDISNLIPSNLQWGTAKEILMKEFGLKDFYIDKVGKNFDKDGLAKKFMEDIPLREKKTWFYGKDLYGNVVEDKFIHILSEDSLDKIWESWIDTNGY